MALSPSIVPDVTFSSMKQDRSIRQPSDLVKLSRTELQSFLEDLQADFQSRLSSGREIDDLLDEHDPFEILEPLLPKEVYPVFVLTMINDINKKSVWNSLLDALEDGIRSHQLRTTADSPNGN